MGLAQAARVARGLLTSDRTANPYRQENVMKSRAVTLVFAILLAALASTAGAVCPNTTETAEQALFDAHGCWDAFRTWFRSYFNLQSGHWGGGWGWDNCNTTEAFTKMMDSGILITYGLRTNTLGPWHSDVDYYKWAGGSQHDFRFEPEDGTGPFAEAFAGWFQTNRVEMRCPSFNNRTAGVRAGTMLHEATHITYWRWSHGSNNPGSNCSDDCTDDWFPHYLNSYSYGSLAGHKHSMNQIQIEYLCDLGEFAEGWVPLSISTTASSESNSRMNNRIRTPPAWSCGTPRPIYTPPPASACPNGQRCCGFVVGGVCDGECWPQGNPCP